MDWRGRGRPRYSRSGDRRYIPVITKSCGQGSSDCLNDEGTEQKWMEQKWMEQKWMEQKWMVQKWMVQKWMVQKWMVQKSEGAEESAPSGFTVG